MTNKFSLIARAATAACALALTVTGATAGDYPDRPISMTVPWAAGGGTDVVARIVAAGLEEQLGAPVNVVNRTGGGGVVGHAAIADAKPDGYTVGFITAEINMMHHLGMTDLDHRSYKLIAMINGEPAGIHVRADSEYETMQDLLDTIASGSKRMTSSGTAAGGVYHLALGGMLLEAGLGTDAVIWVPSQGAAPALQELVADATDFVMAQLPEAQSIVDAGQARTLAVMSAERLDGFEDVPTLKEATGLDVTMSGMRALAVPADTPDEIVATLSEAAAALVESDSFRERMAQGGYGIHYLNGEDLTALLDRRDEQMGEIIQALGLAR
ncbi:tripartite tricarboxylate transporter substrate binding protein [Paracoccus seriniphilus]|uniref:Tripartite-type tricarboxylate transporter, receptor component TctC n=1 Tax=Paracoccus seriniphilus TaxID=184748 RepID=A0A239PUD1_9RHOB|nr:tripartite tricarboxylate transporter substrate binding protein [Paracoccus seriniphilus]WCR16425.1 tripartite tricarboxylate transporter substrate binding protein [Paracoccus seriniphilus]SNT73526.1 Tripartite-type tricarboxylate transporter, receptor component TctC [Paracoccus seriniphilus]